MVCQSFVVCCLSSAEEASTRSVILQPFYLPYGGVFELVRLADVFVFYDDVQFVPQHWQTRNRIKVAGGTQWLTVPVKRRHGQSISEARIVTTANWTRKHRTAIELAYAKAPHLASLESLFDGVYEKDWENLVDLNIAAFRLLAGLLGLQAEFRKSSELALPGRGSDRVLAYCRALGATRYLSGPSGRDYLDEASFATAGVELEYHRFEHPFYSQLHEPFVPGLSVVDLLANEGPAAGKILKGCGSAVPARRMARRRGLPKPDFRCLVRRRKPRSRDRFLAIATRCRTVAVSTDR